MIPDSTVEDIKAAADIFDLVARFVDLIKSGGGYKGLCPFHSERTPSFTVSPSKGLFHCFGCGIGGDAVTFVMKHENKTYPEALEYLAGLYNISIDSTGGKLKNVSVQRHRPTLVPPPQPSYFPTEKMRKSLQFYEYNNFAQFLIQRFGATVASEIIGRYFIGTSKYWPGANIFWQVDSKGHVRSGKIMVYHASTGKRDREKLPNGGEKTSWAHTAAKLKDFNLDQCFFGEHLLSGRPTAPVAIAESEKTAGIASLYLPEFIWLASGGKNGLKSDKFKILKGRRVTLWPDAGLPDEITGKTPFQLWSERAAELQKDGYSVKVSNLIEQEATTDERTKGFDLADYLLKYDLAAFHAEEAPYTAPQSPTSRVLAPPETQPGFRYEHHTDRNTGHSFEVLINADGYPAIWDN